ncbi:hypothetical protein BKA65DRAFT_529430 [Rhexocercosporidium sp. MPI-PUGE-AT-0058]|nr:hypothetical protein BKA65DRAFT_529430 [Rhexocercosporidium sp. MPI-PUGE-AT-0058]
MHRIRQPNYRPVSCIFCRSRKLRCTREFPCSNCVERGISCQLRPPSQVSTSSPLVPTLPNASEVSQAEILQRLETLENIVRNQTSRSRHDVLDQPLLSPATTFPESHPATPHQLQPLAADIARLENDSLSPDGIVFMICPIRHVSERARYIQSSMEQGTTSGFTRCIWLPPYDEAKVVVEKYISNITYLHHVIHTPSLWTIVNELYTDLNQQSQIKPGHVALLLSILASTTYSWTATDCNVSLFPTSEEANRQTPHLIKATEDILDYIHRATCPSLESAQSTIIVLFLVCKLEGLAQRFRSLFTSAIMMARELNLHRTDDPNCSSLEIPEPAPMDTVKSEVGRRVWWYLVATDWMLSRFPGPLHGVYICHPSQMIVNKPRNCNDEDLAVNMPCSERAISEPTVMSYFLQRIRLAELCRHFTDNTPFINSSDATRRYSDAMRNDAELRTFIDNIPPFFRLGKESRREFIESDIYKTPGIIIQRYMLNALVQIQRCKLNLPWFIRGMAEPSYSQSYNSCVDAARLIIQNELQLEQTRLPFVQIRLRFSPMLYGVTMAGVVLSFEKPLGPMSDSQFSKTSPEVSDAFRILREARDHSRTAARLLESIEKVLRKHKMPTPAASPPPEGRQKLARSSVAGQGSSSLWSNTSQTNDSALLSECEGSLQDFNTMVDFEALDWNSILSGLNSSFT